MSDDVLTLVKAAQKERASLMARLTTLKRKEGEFRTKRTGVERRIGEIDAAFAPLKQTLAGANIAPTPPRETGERGGQMNEIVVAIGGFGLREFTAQDLVKVTEIPVGNIYSLLAQLTNAGRLRRMSPGVYRTAQAKIA